MRQIYHFFVNRNEFVVPDCLRQYLSFAVRCRRPNFLPMMNNLFVKFRKMAIKIKKVVVMIALKSSVPPTVERDDFGIYFHGASESEHGRFTQFKLVSKTYRKKQNLSCQDRHPISS